MDPDFKSQDSNFELYHADCFDVMRNMKECSVDMIFVDPPYFLSNGGATCSSGQRVLVNKGNWDSEIDPMKIHRFNVRWLSACQKLLKNNGTIWVSGTRHNIYSVGFAMHQLGFKLLNDITWEKANPPPNLSCRYFTHATETILWAAKAHKSKYTFNYKELKSDNGGKQMKSIWRIGAPRKIEKAHGRHPTQKPLALLERIVKASTEQGDLVFDPFGGSNTTGIAAYTMGRKYIGIEQEENFFDLSVKRFGGIKDVNGS